MTTENTIFTENIRILDEKNPELAGRIRDIVVPPHYTIVQARTGDPVLKIGTRTLHSLYDPRKEAILFVQHQYERTPPEKGKPLVVVGFGCGYHIEALLEKGIRPAVWEPDEHAFYCALMSRPLMHVLSACDVRVGAAWPDQETEKATVWMYRPALGDVRSGCLRNTIHTRENSPRRISGAFKQSLDIMVVSPIYGGSLPIAYSCTAALKRLGHSVRLWDASLFEKPFQKVLDLTIDGQNKKVLFDLFQHLISEMIVAECAHRRPDAVLCLAQAPISLHALQRLREAGVVTAFWFVEDFRFMQYWRTYAPAYDFYCTIQEGAFFDELRRIGVQRYRCLPLAADPEMHRPVALSDDEKTFYGSDLSFMGAGYYNRRQMFTGLLDFDFKIWGSEWDKSSILWQRVQRNGNRVTTEETVKIFNATAVNINLHSSAILSGINPDGDFVNPRTFEIAACGAFQLVDYRPVIERFFEIEREIICYTSLEELREKASYYLRNNNPRKEIARAGRDRVLREHTYDNRMRTLCAWMLQERPDAFYHKHAGRLAVRDVDSFTKEHPEVKPLLDEVAAKGWQPDLDTIVATIRSRSGPMQYPDAVFLLMKEYQALIQEHLQ